jgi:hypothetical protein
MEQPAIHDAGRWFGMPGREQAVARRGKRGGSGKLEKRKKKRNNVKMLSLHLINMRTQKASLKIQERHYPQ